MSPTPAKYRRAISIVGGMTRAGTRPADDPALIAARRDMQEAKLVTYIEKVLAETPPLTVEQRTRLAELLLAGVQ